MALATCFLRMLAVALMLCSCSAFTMSSPRSTALLLNRGLRSHSRSIIFLQQADGEEPSAQPAPPPVASDEPMTADQLVEDTAASEAPTTKKGVDLVDAATLVFAFFTFLSFLPEGIRPF